jgi:tetratricopeptide (TPR) repeat protein
MKNKHKNHNNINNGANLNFSAQAVIFSIMALFLGISFFVWTVYPYAQMASYVKKIDLAINGEPEALTESKFVFEPYTSVQPTIRYRFLYNLFSEYKKGVLNVKDVPLIEFAIMKMDETVKQTDHYPQQFSIMGKMYDALADIAPNDAQRYDTLAEVYYKKAISLSPNNYNQDAKFSYSLNLTNQGRVNEAVLLMRQTVAYDTRPPEGHYYLGLALFKQGEANYLESLNEMEYSFSHKFNPFKGLAKGMYGNFMAYFYHKKDIKNLITVVDRLALLDEAQRDTYIKLSEVMRTYNRIPIIDISSK